MNSNEIIAWSVAAAAAGFVVLCIFLIGLLKTAQKSLASAKSAVDEVKQTVDGLQGEVKKLAETINDVSSNVKGKLQATDPLFDAVRDVGVMLRDVTGSAREASRDLSRAVRRQAAAIESGEMPSNWIRWAALGARVVSGLRKGWQQKHASHEQVKIDSGLPETPVTGVFERSEDHDVYRRISH